jgi:large repetitive protein
MKHPAQQSNQAPVTATSRFAVTAVFAVALAAAGFSPARAAIDNTATASGFYDTTPVNSLPSSETVPVAPSTPALVVSKVATPDINVPAGTLVTYTYKVRNAGNVTLTGITLSDIHNGLGTPPSPGNETLTTDAGTVNDSSDATPNDGLWSVLAPGDEITLTGTYTLLQADVDQRQ